jgi:hypothetical protein
MLRKGALELAEIKGGYEAGVPDENYLSLNQTLGIWVMRS